MQFEDLNENFNLQNFVSFYIINTWFFIVKNFNNNNKKRHNLLKVYLKI